MQRLIFSSFINDLFSFLLLGPDLLDLLLSAHGNDKTSQLTDEELFEEALTFGKNHSEFLL